MGTGRAPAWLRPLASGAALVVGGAAGFEVLDSGRRAGLGLLLSPALLTVLGLVAAAAGRRSVAAPAAVASFGYCLTAVSTWLAQMQVFRCRVDPGVGLPLTCSWVPAKTDGVVLILLLVVSSAGSIHALGLARDRLAWLLEVAVFGALAAVAYWHSRLNPAVTSEFPAPLSLTIAMLAVLVGSVMVGWRVGRREPGQRPLVVGGAHPADD